MGITMGCLKKTKIHPQSDKVINPTVIFSPPSPIQLESASTSILSLNHKIPNKFETEFNYTNLQSIYLGFPNYGGANIDLQLTLPMVDTVENVFEIIDNDLVSSAKKIHFCTSFLGRGFKEKFTKCAQETENVFKHEEDNRMLAHIISYIKFHKMLLNLFKTNQKEAKKCLNLLAYGHMEMNVNATDFRLFDVAIEKFLLKFNVVDEVNLKITISYLNLITNYICYFMKQYTENLALNEMISQEDLSNKKSSWKQLRKWHLLKGKLRYETCPFIEELTENDSNSEYYKRRKSNLCPLSNLDGVYNNMK